MIFQHRLQIIAVVDIICVPEYLNQDYLVNLACDEVLETPAVDKIQISSQSCQELAFFEKCVFSKMAESTCHLKDECLILVKKKIVIILQNRFHHKFYLHL